MGRHIQKGFTVIEVVLVIAITGLLMMGIMGSAFRQVNDQNYRDGVESFKDIIAGQLEDIDALKNEQNNGCSGSASLPGMGECFYSGKLLRISYDFSNESSTITANPIQTTTQMLAAGEVVDSVRKIDSDANVTKVSIPWGVQVRTKGPTSTLLEAFYILIFRDPVSGVTITRFFVNDTNTTPGTLKSIALGDGVTPVVGDEIVSDYLFCLADPNNLGDKQRWLGVKMAHGVPTPSSLTMVGSGQCS